MLHDNLHILMYNLSTFLVTHLQIMQQLSYLSCGVNPRVISHYSYQLEWKHTNQQTLQSQVVHACKTATYSTVGTITSTRVAKHKNLLHSWSTQLTTPANTIIGDNLASIIMRYQDANETGTLPFASPPMVVHG